MAQIFISYARQDAMVAKGLADDLVANGYDVWWDIHLVGVDVFRDEIQKQLRLAKAVIVIWSAHSAASVFVRQEAEEARQFKKLVATRVPGFDVLQIPLGFREQHTDFVTDRKRITAALDKLRIIPGAGGDPRDLQSDVVEYENHSAGLVRTFLGHSDIVATVSFTPDGQTILSGSFDKSVKLWDRRGGDPIWSIEEPKEIGAVTVAPNSRVCAIGGWSDAVLIRDLPTGKFIRRLAAGAVYSCLAFSRDGQHLAAPGRDHDLVVWSLPSYTKKYSLKPEPDLSGDHFEFTPDGESILCDTSGHDVRLWHLASKKIRILSNDQQRGTVWWLAMSPDGRTATSLQRNSRDDPNLVRFWDIKTGAQKKCVAIDNISRILFSPDGRLLLCVGGGRLRFMDVATGRFVKQIIADAVSAAFSPDGRFLVTGSNGGPLELWDLHV